MSTQFIFSEKYLIYSSRYKEQHQMKWHKCYLLAITLITPDGAPAWLLLMLVVRLPSLILYYPYHVQTWQSNKSRVTSSVKQAANDDAHSYARPSYVDIRQPAKERNKTPYQPVLPATCYISHPHRINVLSMHVAFFSRHQWYYHELPPDTSPGWLMVATSGELIIAHHV